MPLASFDSSSSVSCSSGTSPGSGSAVRGLRFPSTADAYWQNRSGNCKHSNNSFVEATQWSLAMCSISKTKDQPMDQLQQCQQQQHQLRASQLEAQLSRLIASDSRRLVADNMLSTVPSVQLPGFYSRGCQPRWRRQCRLLHSDDEAEAADTEEQPRTMAKTATPGGVGKSTTNSPIKRRRLVQTKICDMFPSKKKIRLSCQLGTAAASKKA